MAQSRNGSRDGIAIVGMAALFPGAPDVETYWSNIVRGVSAISEVPAGRLDPAFFGPDSGAGDRFYCRRGGFVDSFATFGATSFGVMPVAARGAEPDQLLTLQLAAKALADAGYQHRPFARDKAGVILGRGGYPLSARVRLDSHVRGAEQLVAALRGLLPDLNEDQLLTVRREFQRAMGAPGKDAVIGLVPNLAASRIAERLDLHGPAFTTDAACASALVAVDQGCQELASGRCDLVIAGGVHFCLDEVFWSVFTQLGALSRHGEIRPFDKRADGLLMGEGAGLVVLKRLSDAHRDEDRVYAVIHGTGIASDGRGASLMSPQKSGQVLAVTRAWQAASWDPSRIGLMEAHGTATQAGDATELETLLEVFGEASRSEERAVLGSVKSMIGHTMPAAGAAGLIKAALAVFHGVLPPTLHCEQPRDEIERSRFRTLSECEPWKGDPAQRIAGVNAFGFGGINAHVVLSGDSAPARTIRSAARPLPRVALFSAASVAELLEDVAQGRERLAGGPARLAVTDPTSARIEKACDIVRRGRPWRERDGVFFSPGGLLSQGGTIAFLFPGVDASFEPRVEDVAEYFDLPLPQYLQPADLEQTGIAIVGVGRLLDTVLRRLGVVPSHVAGHSIGEWSAMISTGVIPEDAVDRLVATLEPGSLEVPGVVFAAAGCDVTRADAAIAGLPEIALSHDNCPHQILICGKEPSIDLALARLRADGVLCQKLPFQSGYHTPLFTSYLGIYRDTFQSLPIAKAREPLWSATSCDRYPDDPDEIRALAVDHLVKPVRFREVVARLHAEGARVFIQVGTGRITNFVEDTLRGRPHVAFSANTKEKTGLERLRALLLLLFVEGAAIDPSLLFEQHKPEMTLSLSAPLVRSFSPLSRTVNGAAENAGISLGNPLAKEWSETLSVIRRADLDVMSEFTRGGRFQAPRDAEFPCEFSLATMPDLIDHTFYRQPLGWPVISDRHPVVPMTTLIQVMLEHAEEMVPGKKAIAIENVRAFRWFVVSIPVHARVSCKFDGKDKVAVRIDDYCEGTVHLGDSYPEDFSPEAAPLRHARPTAIDAETLYRDRWMFHGPQFQGVEKMIDIGDDGIRATLRTPRARGALLDNAGQLLGYWVTARHEENRMAMPVRIARVDLFGRHPAAGEEIQCDVRITALDERSVTADFLLSRGSGAWCRITAWEDRRFETDAQLWAVMLFPEKNLLSSSLGPGLVVFRDRYRAAPTRDQLSRRFLGEAERALYERQTPRQQRAWLNAKIAAKDAVRDLLFREGAPPLFPVEVKIEEERADSITATCEGDTFYVSTVQAGDLAFARASHTKGEALQIVSGDRAAELPRVRVVHHGELSLTWGAKESG